MAVSASERRPSAGMRWYVVQTQPRREELGARNLARQGFGVFLPRFARTVRHARRSSTVLRPLFPGYAFVTFDPEVDRWRAVLGTCGISTLIRRGDRPSPVPEGVVEGLMAAAAAGDGLDFTKDFVVGCSLRFQSGPFAERIGELIEMSDAERVRVLLEFLGSERVVTAPARDLVVVGRGLP
jgi:transcription antitermination factor NusG